MIYSNVVGNVFSKPMPEWGKFLGALMFSIAVLLISFVGGELFTGNCLIIMDVFDKRVTWAGLFRDLFIVFFSNLIGALCVDVLIVFSGNLNYSGGLLGAYTIKVAVSKIAISAVQGITSGILCNMFYIPAGIMAAMNPDYVAKAKDAYGLTVEQIATLTPLHSLQNFIPVTLGNMIGGMLCVGLPLYLIYKKKWN